LINLKHYNLYNINYLNSLNIDIKSSMSTGGEGGPGGPLRQMDNHEAYHIIDELVKDQKIEPRK